VNDVLTLEEVADILRIKAQTPERRRAHVRELIRAGALRAINPNVWPGNWTVSRAELARYIAGEASAS
jgi:hypothetical protein